MSGKKLKRNIAIPQEIRTVEDFKKLCAAMDEQHKLFADHYLVTLNAADSYRKAGYKATNKASVENSAVRLLSNVRVQNYIDWKMKERKKQLQIDENYILEFLQNITKRKITDYYKQDPKTGKLQLIPLDQISPEKLALVEGIADTPSGLRIKLTPILPSLEKLGAHLGMWNKHKQKSSGGEGTQYIIRRYIVPAVGNVMIKPKITVADIKAMVTDHIRQQQKK